MILAGDVGGTKVHVALFDWTDERVDPIRERRYHSADFSSLEEILADFLTPPAPPAQDAPEEQDTHRGTRKDAGAEDDPAKPRDTTSEPIRVEAACFGVAGPVLDNRSRTTNLPWLIDGQELAKRFEIPQVRLVNDVEATAHGLLVLRSEEFETLNAGAANPPKSAKVLIAAGTGLGEAILYWDGTRYRPMASEGGHADFAPTSDLEIDLLRYMRTNYLHVSYERLLSGAGLHAIYEFLRDNKKNEPTWVAEKLKVGDPAAVISQIGLAGQAEICTQALDLFASIYGAEAGNLALKGLALDGVYVGGGMAPKLLAKLQDGTFLRAFTNKGRYKRLLASVPVKVILNQKTALLGAAALAAKLVQQPAA
ncbi:MAG: glucokinase [Nitrospirales bacterium]